MPVVDYPHLCAKNYGAIEAIGNKCFFGPREHLTFAATGNLAATCEKLAEMKLISLFRSKELQLAVEIKRCNCQMTNADRAMGAFARP